MKKFIKKNLYVIILLLFVLIGCLHPMNNQAEARAPKFGEFVSEVTWDWDTDSYVYTISCVSKDKTLRENIVCLFYPQSRDAGGNVIYKVIRDMTLWVMIAFLVRGWASLLFNRKPEDLKKAAWTLLYAVVWWCFIYWANWLFWEVLNFDGASWPMTADADTAWQSWVNPIVNAFIWGGWVMFVVLSALKVFAFFMAIIMMIVTWIRVISAWDWEKGKKLVKWILNIVIALLVIKWIDFIFYIAEDSEHFLANAADLIENVAKIFAYIYWSVIVIMVILAWYFYMTDGWDWWNFKKATNILVNILLSWLVLFAFLLILYQIFAEFRTWWDAVEEAFLFAVRNLV